MAATETVGTLQSHLQNEEYQYWIKAGICLSMLRKCLEDLADISSKELHQLVLSELRDSDIQTYITCKRLSAGYPTRSGCHRSCELFENTVRRYCKNPPKRFLINNINVERLAVDPWEVAKLFMPYGYLPSANPYDADIAGLLSFLSNCSISWKYIKHMERLNDVRSVRNAVIHSGSMKLSRSQFLKYTDSMIDLLCDPIYLAGLPLAQNAVLEIQKIRQSSFQVLKTEDGEGTKILTIAPNKADEDTKSEEGELCAPFSYSIQEYNTQTQTNQSKADSTESEDPPNLYEDTQTCTDTEEETQREKLLKEQYYEKKFVKLKAFIMPILKSYVLDDEKVRTPQMDEATEKIKQYSGRLTKSIPVDEPNQESIHKQGMVSYLGCLTKSIPEDEPKQYSQYKKGMVSYFDCLTKSIPVDKPKQDLQYKQGMVSYLGCLTKSIPEDEPKQDSQYKKGMVSYFDCLTKSIPVDKPKQDLQYKQGMVSYLGCLTKSIPEDEPKQDSQYKKGMVSYFDCLTKSIPVDKPKQDLQYKQGMVSYLGCLTKSIPEDEPKHDSQYKKGMVSYFDCLTKSIPVDKPKQDLQYKKGMVSYLGRLTKSIPEDEPKQDSQYKKALPRSLFSICAQLLSSDMILKTFQFYGPRSAHGDIIISWLCARIREMSTRVIHVWVGYDIERDNTPLFIAVMSEKDKSLYENFQTICPFEVIQRLLDDVSEEAKLCMKKEIDRSFTLLEHSELHDAIVENSEELLKSHSNLLMISASAFKSSKAGNNLEMRTCIVLYVHVKGIIPLKEKPFPLNIGKFPVDVREGIVKLYSDLKLTVGCNIASAYMCGRLGGFVRLHNGKVGCITCSHLFDTIKSRKDKFQDRFNKNVFFRSKDGQLYHFGHLIKEVIRPGDKTSIGVDAALIEITDKPMCPEDGSFETTEIPLAADSEQPSGFHSGEILTSPQEIAELQTNKNAKCKIVRYDDTNKHMYICTGVLKVSGTTLDAYYPTTLHEKCRLYAQMEIHPCPPAEEFANFGDSGSLVFLVDEHTDDIWAIGMVVGGVSSGAGIVTPIWSILESFNLPKNLLSFENKRIKKIEHGMKYIQSQMKYIHHQTQTLADMHHQTQKDLAGINNETQQALAGITNQTQQDLTGMRHQIQQDLDGKLNPIHQALAESRLPPKKRCVENK